MTEATTATVTSPNHRIARAVNITTLTIIVVLGITFLVGEEPVFEIIVLAVWCLLSRPLVGFDVVRHCTQSRVY